MHPLPTHWVFDLDGTLTIAQHDFAALKRSLGLPPDRAVLEGIEARPAAERPDLLDAVHRWEVELADQAVPAPDAQPLLEALHGLGARLGVLTRNTRSTALRTLTGAGLARWFDDDDVLGRDSADPKPAPDGLLVLLGRWQIAADRAVMVGDHPMDLRAGRAAGTATVWLDRAATGAVHADADVTVVALDHLLRRTTADTWR